MGQGSSRNDLPVRICYATLLACLLGKATLGANPADPAAFALREGSADWMANIAGLLAAQTTDARYQFVLPDNLGFDGY